MLFSNTVRRANNYFYFPNYQNRRARAHIHTNIKYIESNIQNIAHGRIWERFPGPQAFIERSYKGPKSLAPSPTEIFRLSDRLRVLRLEIGSEFTRFTLVDKKNSAWNSCGPHRRVTADVVTLRAVHNRVISQLALRVSEFERGKITVVPHSPYSDECKNIATASSRHRRWEKKPILESTDYLMVTISWTLVCWDTHRTFVDPIFVFFFTYVVLRLRAVSVFNQFYSTRFRFDFGDRSIRRTFYSRHFDRPFFVPRRLPFDSGKGFLRSFEKCLSSLSSTTWRAPSEWTSPSPTVPRRAGWKRASSRVRGTFSENPFDGPAAGGTRPQPFFILRFAPAARWTRRRTRCPRRVRSVPVWKRPKKPSTTWPPRGLRRRRPASRSRRVSERRITSSIGAYNATRRTTLTVRDLCIVLHSTCVYICISLCGVLCLRMFDSSIRSLT